MAILEVLTYPNPLLKKVSEAVEFAGDGSLDDETKLLIEDLLETMYSFPGCVGIASPQTGNLKRIVIIDASRNRKPVPNSGRQVMINPRVVEASGAVLGREGCLSLPDFTANVVRAQHVTVHFHDERGEERELKASDFEARVALHEMDHLDGLLFLDRVSSLKTDVFRRKRYAHPPQKAATPGEGT